MFQSLKDSVFLQKTLSYSYSSTKVFLKEAYRGLWSFGGRTKHSPQYHLQPKQRFSPKCSQFGSWTGGKTAENPAVMVNFMCQLDWTKGCPDNWQNIISKCVWENVSRRDYHLNG